MKLLSALFDVCLIPVGVVQDVFTLCDFGDKSYTRSRIEKVEEDLSD